MHGKQSKFYFFPLSKRGSLRPEHIHTTSSVCILNNTNPDIQRSLLKTAANSIEKRNGKQQPSDLRNISFHLENPLKNMNNRQTNTTEEPHYLWQENSTQKKWW